MCYAKPGPRCSAHAREALDKARDALDEFTGVHDADLGDIPTAARLRNDHEAALRDYETTPEGQRQLKAALDALNGSGDPDDIQAAALMSVRLDEARATRVRQLAAVHETADYEQRLTTMSPAETAAIDNAEAALWWAEQCVQEAERQHEEGNISADQVEFERYIAENAERDLRYTRALIGSGLGQSYRPLNLDQPHQSALLARNSDPHGTLNAAAYDPPSPGFVHGQFHRAVDLRSTDDGLVLVFSDGTRTDTHPHRPLLLIDPGPRPAHEPAQLATATATLGR